MTSSSAGVSQSAREPVRVVVVVPRSETQLHDYLRRSLGALKNVEVILDRRTLTVGRAQERRRQPSTGSESRILMCSLVRCPSDEPTQTEVAAGDTAKADEPRPLRWPGLRLENF